MRERPHRHHRRRPHRRLDLHRPRGRDHRRPGPRAGPADPVKALGKFKTKYDLALTLATDEGKGVLGTYGVWVEKSMYGRKYMGVDRVTVLVDRYGQVARIWPKVKIEGHAAEVLEAARAL